MKLMMLASGKSYHATRWANALVNAGLSVTFVTIHRLVRPLNANVELVELRSVGKLSYVLVISRVRALVKKIQPSLVHSHSAGGYALMGRFCGARPWILSVYGTDVYDSPLNSPLHKMVIKNFLNGADQLLATSHAMAKQVTMLYPTLSLPIVTPFGVDTQNFSPTPSCKRKKDIIKIGIVKKLEKKYGIDILIKAFNVLVQDYDGKVELHIVGEGSEKERLLAMKKRSACASRIFFHGSILNSEVPQFLNGLDIFVVPSRYESESFGVAAVEASAVGLPIIVSDVGGLPEVVEHEKTGIVVRREDPEALANAINRLIKSPTDRKRLGAAARQKVEVEYDWRKNVSDMIRIYENALSVAKKSEMQ